jgi:hypothetical protein
MDRPEVKNRKEEHECEVPHGSMGKGEKKRRDCGDIRYMYTLRDGQITSFRAVLRNAFTPKHVRVQPSLQAQPRLAFLELDMRDFHH